MAIKGLRGVRANIKRELGRNVNEKAARAMNVAGSIIGGYATLMTPVDTSTLVNSQYRRVIVEGSTVIAAIGYTAKYAKWVHNSPGTLKGQPRAHFGKTRAGQEFGGGSGKGNYWSPNAEPQFLTKAGDDNKAEIDTAVFEVMKI